MVGCEQCGGPLNTGKRFCSLKCSRIYRKERPLCKVCGKPVKWPTYKFCSTECHHIWQRGENHWNWQGGITKTNTHKYRTTRWLKLSRRIKKRDNYECKICFSSELMLDVHHIYPAKSYPELFWEESNLITLCVSCHHPVEGTDWGIEHVIIPEFGEIS